MKLVAEHDGITTYYRLSCDGITHNAYSANAVRSMNRRTLWLVNKFRDIHYGELCEMIDR